VQRAVVIALRGLWQGSAAFSAGAAVSPISLCPTNNTHTACARAPGRAPPSPRGRALSPFKMEMEAAGLVPLNPLGA
jgi:hypothetical protein